MLKTWPVLLKDFLLNRTTELQQKLFPGDREHTRRKKEYRRATPSNSRRGADCRPRPRNSSVSS